MVDVALAGQVLIWLLVVGVFLASGQASIFHPFTLYLGFHAVVFVLRPILVCYLDFDSVWSYMVFEPTEARLLQTMLVSSTALMIFGASCVIVGWTRPKFVSAAPSPFQENQRLALIVTTVLLAPVIAYSIYQTGSGAFSGQHRGGVFIMTGATGYSVEAQYMAGPVIAAWLIVTRFSRAALIPLALYIAYRAYMGWSRWTIALFFLMLAVVFAWQHRKKWLAAWAVLMAVPLFFMFHTMGKNRAYFTELLKGGEAVAKVEKSGVPPREKWKLEYDTLDFANFDYLTYVLAMVPDRTGMYTHGAQYLQLFTEPIPRKLWKRKPIGAPVRLFNLNAYGNFLGLTVSLPGDAWMSGGWVGLFIMMSLAGCGAGLAHRWFWKHIHSNFASIFYLVGLAMLPQWYRDGGISIAKFLFWNWSPLLLWLLLSWWLGRRWVPAWSVILPAQTRLRLVQPSATTGRIEDSPLPISPSKAL